MYQSLLWKTCSWATLYGRSPRSSTVMLTRSIVSLHRIKVTAQLARAKHKYNSTRTSSFGESFKAAPVVMVFRSRSSSSLQCQHASSLAVDILQSSKWSSANAINICSHVLEIDRSLFSSAIQKPVPSKIRLKRLPKLLLSPYIKESKKHIHVSFGHSLGLMTMLCLRQHLERIRGPSKSGKVQVAMRWVSSNQSCPVGQCLALQVFNSSHLLFRVHMDLL